MIEKSDGVSTYERDETVDMRSQYSLPHKPSRIMMPEWSPGRDRPRQGGMSPPGYMELIFRHTGVKKETNHACLAREPSFQNLERRVRIS